MSDDNHSRDERADVFVHPDYVRAAVSAIQAAHAGGSRSVEFFDEVRIGLSAALPLALAVLREQLAKLEAERKADNAAVAAVLAAAIQQRSVKPPLADAIGHLHRQFANRITIDTQDVT